MEHDQLLCVNTASGRTDLDSAEQPSCNRTVRPSGTSPCRIIKPKLTCETQLMQLDSENSGSVFYFSLPSTTSEYSVSEVCSSLHSFSSVNAKEAHLAPFSEYKGRRAITGGALEGSNKTTGKRRQGSRHGYLTVFNKGTSVSSRSGNNSTYNSVDAYSLSECSRQFSLQSMKSISGVPISESVPSCSLTCFAEYSSTRMNTTNRPRLNAARQFATSGCSDSLSKHPSAPSTPNLDRMNFCIHSNKACNIDHAATQSGSFHSGLPCNPQCQSSRPDEAKSLTSQHFVPPSKGRNLLSSFPKTTAKNTNDPITSTPDKPKGHTEVVDSSNANTPANSEKSVNNVDSLEKKNKNIKQDLSDAICAGEFLTDTTDSPADDKLWRVWQAKREVRVGRGSSGDVYRGIDLNTGRTIAIKELLVPKDFSKDMEKQLQLLEREINVMRKLRHPNIINYLGAARESNCINVFMEYVPGGTLADQLRFSGPLSEDRARHYTKQLLSGLEYLHEQRIVHRDLKGDNLFIYKDDVLKLGDFGTSKELATTLVTDSVAGTPNFMAPEVIACSGHSYAADIWSVGCCVVEMLTGKPPFSSLDNQMAVMFAIIKGKICNELPAHVSAAARDFFKACTQHEPKDRCTVQDLQNHSWICGDKSFNCSFGLDEAPCAVKKPKRPSHTPSVQSYTRYRGRTRKSRLPVMQPISGPHNAVGPIPSLRPIQAAAIPRQGPHPCRH